MKNPLLQAQRSALSMNNQIGGLFGQVGTHAAPRGFVQVAYRNARRAMKTVIGELDPVGGTREVYDGLRRTLRREAFGLLADAQAAGGDEAARQLSLYGIRATANANPADLQAKADAVVAAMLAQVDAQEAATIALLLTDSEPVQIVGDDDGATGVLKPSDIALGLTTWTATLLWDAFSGTVFGATPAGVQFSKQVVAALDERTTDCCLQAHAQIKPLTEPFTLTGRPRFADALDWTPFHWYCRTSVALYQPVFDDGLTAAMRSGADTILAERASGGTGGRNPADGYG